MYVEGTVYNRHIYILISMQDMCRDRTCGKERSDSFGRPGNLNADAAHVVYARGVVLALSGMLALQDSSFSAVSSELARCVASDVPVIRCADFIYLIPRLVRLKCAKTCM
jgi:hypothetical protein